MCVYGSCSQPNYLEIATVEIHINISEIFTYGIHRPNGIYKEMGYGSGGVNSKN